MKIGVPKEIKDNENRVAITTAGVTSFVQQGHSVYIEEGAGLGSGITDEAYREAGALLCPRQDVFSKSQMIMKVKEPLKEEYSLFHEEQILFTFLHLAAEEELTLSLMESKVTAIAYETIQLKDGSLPLLTPMSEVAGRLATQAGVHYLEKPQGGCGVLLGGVPGVSPSRVVVIGGGIVGLNAAKMAKGLGARVVIIDVDAKRLRYLDDIFFGEVETLISTPHTIAQEVSKAHLVIGAVLIPGAKAPKLVTEEMIKNMKEGSVIVDVAIDQGGCIETTYPTTHSNPIFVKHGVIHYSVANMPGAVARTSTFALTNATLPYALKIAKYGFKEALERVEELEGGVNVYKGSLTYRPVAEAFGMSYTPLEELL